MAIEPTPPRGGQIYSTIGASFCCSRWPRCPTRSRCSFSRCPLVVSFGLVGRGQFVGKVWKSQHCQIFLSLENLFVVHYEGGVRFVGEISSLQGGGSPVYHFRQRNQNREQLQTQGVLHLHLKQRLWIQCLGWQKPRVKFRGILPGKKL